MFRLAGMLVGSAAVTLLIVLCLGLSGDNGLARCFEHATATLADAGRRARAFVAETADSRAAAPARAPKSVAEALPSIPTPVAKAPATPSSPDAEALAPPSSPPGAHDVATVEIPVERGVAHPVAPQAERTDDMSPGPGLTPARHAEPMALEVEGWHAVWMPFYSERSAQGFADRLARTTGLDYRVGKTAPGRYQVSVAYRDEADRRRRLEEIARVTGLAVEVLQP